MPAIALPVNVWLMPEMGIAGGATVPQRLASIVGQPDDATIDVQWTLPVPWTDGTRVHLAHEDARADVLGRAPGERAIGDVVELAATDAAGTTVSSTADPPDDVMRGAVESASIHLNGALRVVADGSYFTSAQPVRHAPRAPSKAAYLYSFALDPFDGSRATGSCNLSRVDEADLRLHLADPVGASPEHRSINVHAISWNVLRIRKGCAAVAFAT